MTERALSSYQREILEAMARQWQLIRWQCNDGRRRWHLGEDEVDGRSVRGLLRRGLLEPGGVYAFDQLVLTNRGRTALT